MKCIFCDIIQKNTPADIVDDDDNIITFKDIHPKAPFHVLVVPKKHIASLKEIKEDDAALLGAMIMKACDIARRHNFDGYKLLFNVGRQGGQLIDHLHLHLMGGWSKMPDEL